MKRVDPLLLRPPKTSSKVYEFKDSRHPELVYAMELRSLEGLLLVNAMSLANDMYAKHNVGYGPPRDSDGLPDTEHPSYTPPVPLPPINDEALEVSLPAWQTAAGIHVAQVLEETDEPYSIMDIIFLMARSKEITQQISKAYVEIQTMMWGDDDKANPTNES